MKREQAIRYLSKDPLLHMDMLESIRRDHAQLLDVSDRGVLILNKPSQAVMMSAENSSAADRMLAAVTGASMFVAHQEFYVDQACKKFALKPEVICCQAAYLEERRIGEPRSSVVIRQLDERYLPFIMRHYSHADDEEYQRERLRSGVMFGAFVDGKLAGFAGMHAEGSIGMLEVLPEYRRRGIALLLESFIANRMLDRGVVPFSQIVVGNTASLELHRKLRFSISDKRLYWLT